MITACSNHFSIPFCYMSYRGQPSDF